MSRTPGDLARELQKVADVIEVADKHFTAEAEMNAAQHMAPVVRPAPLAVAVNGAKADLNRIIDELLEDAG